MGYGRLRRLVTVELPLATPVIIAGLRIGVVASISLASVGQLIGVSSLGYLFIDGLQRSFPTEIYVGLFLVIVLALVCDLILVVVRRALHPAWHGPVAGLQWRRGGGRVSFFCYAWDWMTTGANWHGSGSIPQQLLAHLGYSALPLLIAALIAIPAGVAIGHRGGQARRRRDQRRQRLARHPHPRPADPAGRLPRLLHPHLAAAAGRAGHPADPHQRLRGRRRASTPASRTRPRAWA